MAKKLKGKLVIIDGLDGSGKGTIVRALQKWAKGKKMKVLDLKNYGRAHHSLPEPKELSKYKVIISAEPTFSLIGRAIREEIIYDNKRPYSGFATAQAFALDRYILYQRVIIPALKQGKYIFQERGVTTSIIFQPVQDKNLSLNKITSLEGNQLALKYRPDLLMIVKVKPQTALKRLKARKHKRDLAIFEMFNFQTKFARRFVSAWFRRMFERRGSKVIYIEAETSIKKTVEQAVGEWEEFLG